jgi:glycosyltransferase involved in cell wall biosynthesis
MLSEFSEALSGCEVGAPLLTIAIPAYNRPALLREALASIASQTLRIPFEVVVCDDLGSEETRRVVERYPSGVYRYKANPEPMGAVGNWNQCLASARGKWVMVLHEDDALYPWYFESVVPHLNAGSVAVSTLTVRGSSVRHVRRPSGAPRVTDYPAHFFLKSAMTPFPGVLVRRDVALRLGGFDERWGPVADYDFWYRLSCSGTIRQVRVAAAFYRVAPGQWTESVWARMLNLTHLLRLRIAAEQFPEDARMARCIARFFTYRNALCYARRFAERPAALRRCLDFNRMAISVLPSGWVWQAYKLLARALSRPSEPSLIRASLGGGFARKASGSFAATRV